MTTELVESLGNYGVAGLIAGMWAAREWLAWKERRLEKSHWHEERMKTAELHAQQMKQVAEHHLADQAAQRARYTEFAQQMLHKIGGGDDNHRQQVSPPDTGH